MFAPAFRTQYPAFRERANSPDRATVVGKAFLTTARLRVSALHVAGRPDDAEEYLR